MRDKWDRILVISMYIVLVAIAAVLFNIGVLIVRG